MALESQPTESVPGEAPSNVWFSWEQSAFSGCVCSLNFSECGLPHRDRTEHGGLLMPQLRVGTDFVVFDPGLSLGCYPGVGAGLAPSSPQALITSSTWRGSASIQSPRELHSTVLLRIWSCLSRSAASPIICVLISYLSLNFRISHSASSLEVTSSPCTEALIPHASLEYKHMLARPLRKTISSKKPPSSHSQF